MGEQATPPAPAGCGYPTPRDEITSLTDSTTPRVPLATTIEEVWSSLGTPNTDPHEMVKRLVAQLLKAERSLDRRKRRENTLRVENQGLRAELDSAVAEKEAVSL